MKRLFTTLALAVATITIAHAAAIVGQPAPDFTIKDINGAEHKLADYKGKLVVIESYNLDCPFCANHFKSGAMQELQGSAAEKGVVWLIINSVNAKHPSHRTAEAAKKEIAEQKIKATAWLDDTAGTLGKSYDLKTTPHLVIIDKAGVVAYNGAIDDREESDGDPRTAKNRYVKTALDELLAGKVVTIKESKPYGCSVKY